MKRLLLPAILLILLAGIYISYCSAIDADRTLPNTTVNDTDISDMTFKEASDALEADARKRQKSSVFTVSYAGCDYTLSVGSALQMDPNAAAQEALRKSQTGFFLRGLTRLGARFTENHIQYPKMSTDAEEFHRILEDSRILDKKNADPDSYKIENEQLLITAKSAWKVDEEALMRELAAAIQTKDFSGTIECPLACDDLDNLERIYDELHTA